MFLCTFRNGPYKMSGQKNSLNLVYEKLNLAFETDVENTLLIDIEDGNDIQTKYIIITGEVLYETLQDSCWDEYQSYPEVTDTLRCAIVLKLQLYANKFKCKSIWIALQRSLTVYLRKNNLTLTNEARARLYIVLEYFDPRSTKILK